VNKYDATAGYGFIQRNDGRPNIFTHAHHISDRANFEAIKAGAPVSFVIGVDSRGRATAKQVKLV
jgi:cold shock CspA family protein